MNNDWTPELRKQHRKMTTNWHRPTPRDPKVLGNEYAKWWVDQGFRQDELPVFPLGKTPRSVSDRTRKGLHNYGLRLFRTVSPGDYT